MRLVGKDQQRNGQMFSMNAGWGGGSPFSFSPNMVRKTVKLMGPLASLIMASSSSFFTFSWPEGSKHGF